MTQQPFLGSHRGIIYDMNLRDSAIPPHFQVKKALHLSQKKVGKLFTLRLPGRFPAAAALTSFRIERSKQKT